MVDRDLKNLMQQSGGLLLAARLDGGNTIIFIPCWNENANRFPSAPPNKTDHFDTRSI